MAVSCHQEQAVLYLLQQSPNCLLPIELVELDQLHRYRVGNPELDYHFGSVFLRVEVVESTTNQGDWGPVFLHCSQREDAYPRLEWDHFGPVVASSLRKDPHTSSLSKLTPNVRIQLMIIHLGNHLVFGREIYFLYRNSVHDYLSVTNHLLDSHLPSLS